MTKIEKTEDSFEDFKKLYKEWGGVNFDQLMFHICMLPKKTIADLRLAMPEILKQMATEISE